MQQYKYIYFSCPIDGMAKFYPGDARNQRFSVDAYRYRFSSSSTVYIHCIVSLCVNSSTIGKCQSGCSGDNLNCVKSNGKDHLATDTPRCSYYAIESGPIIIDNRSRSKIKNGKFFKYITSFACSSMKSMKLSRILRLVFIPFCTS